MENKEEIQHLANKLREANFGWPVEDDEFYDLARFCFDIMKKFLSVSKTNLIKQVQNPWDAYGPSINKKIVPYKQNPEDTYHQHKNVKDY
jgi:hypothetical protein